MNVKQAKAIVGSLGKPSKMPGLSYGLPAGDAPWMVAVCEAKGLPLPVTYGCAVGSKMMKCAGTTCSDCYAQKGQYPAPAVRYGQAKRAVAVYHPKWEEAMVFLIKRYLVKHFRWHDSGDLLGVWHLERIVRIAEATPETYYWLPTRETGTIKAFRDGGGVLPSNLVVRVSATKVDGRAPVNVHTSTVHKDAAPIGHVCPAPEQGGNCGGCRACWSQDVANVSYHIH